MADTTNVTAISTYKTFLMKGTDKLIDIKDFPDLGGKPEMLETTTLSDKMQTFIEGIQSQDGMEFTANYTPSNFKAIEELKGQLLDLAVWFGGTEADGKVTPTGAFGKFSFKGTVSASIVGADVNKVVYMKIYVTPSTVITFSEGSAT